MASGYLLQLLARDCCKVKESSRELMLNRLRVCSEVCQRFEMHDVSDDDCYYAVHKKCLLFRGRSTVVRRLRDVFDVIASIICEEPWIQTSVCCASGGVSFLDGRLCGEWLTELPSVRRP